MSEKADQPPFQGAELTEEHRRKVAEWFERVRGFNPNGATCPICANKNWTLGGHLVAPPTFHFGAMVLGGPAYPHFMIICTNCGTTQFVNAVAARLIEPEPPDATS